MANLQIQGDESALAQVAATHAAEHIIEKIKSNDRCVWVLSGGTAPLAAYEVLARDYKEKIDWQKVWVLVGDERCVDADQMESNWEQINLRLLSKVDSPKSNQLKPDYSLNADAAAARYNEAIATLPLNGAGQLEIDYIWLGVGEDGHTLSLFPGQLDLNPTTYVVPVHNSPKPPSDRISLSLKALQAVGTCLILATGENKASAIAASQYGDTTLPITQVIQQIESNGGRVTWLVDQAAATQIEQI